MPRDGGRFVYEAGHYAVSQARGERVLFPAARGTEEAEDHLLYQIRTNSEC